MDSADFLRARPEYKNPRPGIMSRTIHDATIMNAWSPDWYHWFKFSVAVKYDNQHKARASDFGIVNVPESPPVKALVPLNGVGAPIHE
jgi:hypothetical protein